MQLKYLLCRRRLNPLSGAGQLIRMQAKGLRAAGIHSRLYCDRSPLKFFLATGLLARRVRAEKLQHCGDSPRHLLVDHGMGLTRADVVFVHNLVAEAAQCVPEENWRQDVTYEARYFDVLKAGARVVANSELVRRGLVERFSLDPARVRVFYPGFEVRRFRTERVNWLRAKARQQLSLDDSVPLVGLVTSGSFRKRGLDLFLETAARIVAKRPQVRFLVAGSKVLPEWALSHPLVRTRCVVHEPESARRELWFAALDLFLYPARYEEFGMVVAEAMALGLPVLTSRRVGASECLPSSYQPWLLDDPDPSAFAEQALTLMGDMRTRSQLGAAGVQGAAALDETLYADASVELLRESAAAKSGLLRQNRPDSAVIKDR